MIRINRSRNRIALAAAMAALTLFFSACGPSGYVDPVTKFQAAAGVVIASTRLYVTSLNKVERDHYISQKVNEQGQIKLPEIEASQVFSAEGIKARLDALDQLSSYADLLVKLANSDAPAKISAQATDLGQSLNALSTTVSKLSGADDTNFKNAVSAATGVIGLILSDIAGNKIDSALNKAIQNGEVPVNNLITVIGNDIKIAYERKRQALSDTRPALVDAYNKEMLKGKDADPEKLRTYADRISSNEDLWETFETANPSVGLEAMTKAHSALVKYARSAHKITDLASLVDAMEAFAAQAQAIGKAVQSLQGK